MYLGKVVRGHSLHLVVLPEHARGNEGAVAQIVSHHDRGVQGREIQGRDRHLCICIASKIWAAFFGLFGPFGPFGPFSHISCDVVSSNIASHT